MLPNGDKIINTDINCLKIVIKPHIFLMSYYFFINAFPVYQQSSKDKPSYFNDNQEDLPKLDFKL